MLGVEVQLPIQRMTWKEAMNRFGSDKPDLRFGMELVDVSETVKDTEFVVFKGALENGGSVRGINAKGQGAMPRKKIDKLVEFAKGYGAKGLAYIAIHEDGSWKSSFSKFMTEEQMEALIKAMDGQAGDLLLFAHPDNIRLIIRCCLFAGLALSACVSVFIPVLTLQAHSEQICQKSFSGTFFPIQNICMGNLICFYRIFNILYYIFVSNHVFKTAHIITCCLFLNSFGYCFSIA